MKRLVVNADDFGLSQGVNLGILRAHKQGIVTSATVMMNMPAAAEALELARSTPTLGVGIHITLTGGRPLSGQVPSLTGPDGRFLKIPALRTQAEPEELEREIRAQVASFLASGVRPDHLDSHHHVHLEIKAVGEIVARVAAELGIPVRGMGTAPDLITAFYGLEQIAVGRLLPILEGLPENSVSELMCHPAYLDPELLRISSYTTERVMELATLIDPATLEAVAAQEITLAKYRDLA